MKNSADEEFCGYDSLFPQITVFAVAQLYVGQQSGWRQQGTGAALFVKENVNRSWTIRFIDLDVRRGTGRRTQSES